MINRPLKLIECPRDAMQGWKYMIPTEQKVAYLNQLLRTGFDTLDFGSFVSPKAIPQMADTAEVVRALDLSTTSTKLLAIVANERGATDAIAFEAIQYLGFPFSVSETFQQRNTHSTIQESLTRVENIQDLCIKNGKELVVYLSMGFGNPYGDPYNAELVFQWANRLAGLGINTLSLADTVGIATPAQVHDMTKFLVEALPSIEIGVHLHATPTNWKEKLHAALKAGCSRIDAALKGIGGCPMANDELVGNMNMENIIRHLDALDIPTGIDTEQLNKSLVMAETIFNN